MNRWLGYGLAGLVLTGAVPCCSPAPPAPPQQEHATLVRSAFEQLYPVFLQHKIERGRKATLWAKRYRGRWVRWTGQLVSFTDNGVTFKQLASTVTFDVSLKLDPAQRDTLKRRLRPGDFFIYSGRFETYDDSFRTFYLSNGTVSDSPVEGAGLAPPPIAGAQPLDIDTDAPEED